MTMEINQVNTGAVQAMQLRSATKSALPAMSKPPAPASESLADPDAIKLTHDEKRYFEDAFPGAANEIRQHAIYHKNGIRPSSALGTVVDRRG